MYYIDGIGAFSIHYIFLIFGSLVHFDLHVQL